MWFEVMFVLIHFNNNSLRGKLKLFVFGRSGRFDLLSSANRHFEPKNDKLFCKNFISSITFRTLNNVCKSFKTFRDVSFKTFSNFALISLDDYACYSKPHILHLHWLGGKYFRLKSYFKAKRKYLVLLENI